MPVDTLALTITAPPLVRSLRLNGIRAKGAVALAAVLKDTKITTLECAAYPQSIALVSTPIDTPCSLGILSWNQLCGITEVYGCGTYTVEGITKLCEGLKGSSVTSLMCAATQ